MNREEKAEELVRRLSIELIDKSELMKLLATERGRFENAEAIITDLFELLLKTKEYLGAFKVYRTIKGENVDPLLDGLYERLNQPVEIDSLIDRMKTVLERAYKISQKSGAI